MATREQLKARAYVAARLNRDIINKAFHDRLIEIAPVDSDGDAIVMAAGSEESAAVTIHRFERSDDDRIALATVLKDQVRIVIMGRSESSNWDSISVPGDLTVGQWVDSMDRSKGKGYNVDGSEFAPEISGISLMLL